MINYILSYMGMDITDMKQGEIHGTSKHLLKKSCFKSTTKSEWGNGLWKKQGMRKRYKKWQGHGPIRRVPHNLQAIFLGSIHSGQGKFSQYSK